MHDARRMRRIQSVGNIDGEGQQRFEIERPATDAMLQRHAIEELHGDERLALFIPDVVDGADVRMVQRRSCLRLTLKTRQRLRVLGDLFRQEFEGDKTMETGVFGLVDHPHTTAT